MFLVNILYLFFAIFVSFKTNKDYFSPVKFYLAYLFMYFFDIFINNYTFKIHLVYLYLISLGFVFILIENYIMKDMVLETKLKWYRSLKSQRKFIYLIWFLSSIPILAQFYLIYLDGGIIGYINKIGLRVDGWKGLGPILVLKKILPLLNYIYLIVGLNFSVKNKKQWWMLYLIHFLILIFIGLLSGSRGSTLDIFIVLLVCANYFKKRISILKISSLAIILLSTAILLSFARSNLYYNDGLKFKSTNDYSEIEYDVQLTKYGLIPLKYLYEDKKYTDLKYGETFLTVVTNFIPRKLWPSKPDTGGLVLTKYYAKPGYSDYSNFSTGLVGESIINFGYNLGIIYSFIFFVIIAILVVKYYRKFLKIISSNESLHSNIIFLRTTVYFIILQRVLAANLLGEFTNIFFTLIQKLILFELVFYFIKKQLVSKNFK